MNWTVSLSWASLFFISVVDGEGNSWAHGPLHSGSGRTACLSLGDVRYDRNSLKTQSTLITIASSMSWVGPSIAVGAGVGGLFIGSLLGIAAAYFFMKYRQRKERSGSFMHLEPASPLLRSPQAPMFPLFLSYKPSGEHSQSGHRQNSSLASSHISADISGPLLNDNQNRVTQFYIEPFVAPSEDERLRTAQAWEGRPTAHGVPLSPRNTRVAVSVSHPDGTEDVENSPESTSKQTRNQRVEEEKESQPLIGKF
ncbi:hypothetical protein DXG03_004463 [Asterophora parasitica]|uniref:Uncharacterized protein n=1 Tax=Asterophora parasitica TaxID=117018 RepID=A0A9P7GB08_9AGAR|nr:hypothetical protein DXG03_004463 [Asterophora parasitica]